MDSRQKRFQPSFQHDVNFDWNNAESAGEIELDG